MREAYRRTRKDGAAGIDGVTAEDYGKDLGVNLDDLLNLIKSGSYVAPPVRAYSKNSAWTIGEIVSTALSKFLSGTGRSS